MATITKDKIQVDFKINTQVEEQHNTIVHCSLKTDGYIRVWPTTYLVCNDGNKYQLQHAIDITLYPYWCEPIIKNGYAYFTLIFEGLPKSIQSFYLLEEIPEPGGFYSNEHTRNNSGVYSLELFCD
jgi:hypothetical protein